MGSGNTLAGADEMKTPSVKVHESLLEEFDCRVEESSRWNSRSHAIRELMKREVGEELNDRREANELAPPVEDDLAKAYRTILRLSTARGGWVSEEIVISELSQQHSMAAASVRRMLVVPLDRRGYLIRSADPTGYGAVKPVRPKNKER